MALARKVPIRIWEWTKRRMILTVVVRSHDALFHWTKIWLDAQPFTQRCRSLEASTDQEARRNEAPIAVPQDREDRRLPKIIFTPAQGIHVFIYQRRIIVLSRSKETPGNSEDFSFRAPTESMTLTVLGREPALIRRLMQEAMVFAQPPEDPRIMVTVSVYGYWKQAQRVQPRSLESVVLPYGVTERLLADVREFLDSESFYREIGIPWRRGWLLQGVPGSGKSSSIIALAGYLKLNVYVLNISGKGMTDERLADLLCDVPPHSVVLLEDIDATFDKREKDKDDLSGVTFSGLLNVLDGVASKDGRLLFMTTNHPERLDPALTRPGRVDMTLEFSFATVDQLHRLYQRFHPGQPSGRFLAECQSPITMAEAQGLLLAQRTQSQSVAAD